MAEGVREDIEARMRAQRASQIQAQVGVSVSFVKSSGSKKQKRKTQEHRTESSNLELLVGLGFDPGFVR